MGFSLCCGVGARVRSVVYTCKMQNWSSELLLLIFFYLYVSSLLAFLSLMMALAWAELNTQYDMRALKYKGANLEKSKKEDERKRHESHIPHHGTTNHHC